MSYEISPTPSTSPSSPPISLDPLHTPEDKVCPNCKESKPLTEFHARKDRRSGRRHVCKACHRTKYQAWRQKGFDDKRKEALDFAQKLMSLAENAPDEESRSDLNRAVHRLRLRFSQKGESKQDAVLRALEPGELTLKEIIEDTGLCRADVQEVLDYLMSARVDLVGAYTRGSRERGLGRASNTLCYYLVRNR